MTDTAEKPPCQHPASHCPLWLLAGVTLIALTLIAGWLSGLYPLGDHLSATTKLPTAVAFLLCAGIGMQQYRQRGGTVMLAAATALLVVLSLSQPFMPSDQYLQPMSLPAAATLLCALASQVLRRHNSRRVRQIAELLAGLVFYAGMVFLLIHLYGATHADSDLGLRGVALPTAVLTLLLGMALIMTSPGGQVRRLYLDQGSAGLALRGLLLPMIVVLPLAGWLRLQGQLAGWYGFEEGLAITVGSAITIPLLLGLVMLRRMQAIEAERQLAEAARAEAHFRTKRIIDCTGEPIFVKDSTCHYTLVNQATATALQMTTDEVIGRTDFELFTAAEAQSIHDTDVEVLATGSTINYERMLEMNGVQRVFLTTKSPLHDQHGTIVGLIGVAHDITERKRYEEELSLLATHDKLTGLPNHTLLIDRLHQAIAHAEREHKELVVACFDLDDFHLINEEISYEAGNELIRAIARRLAGLLRSGDTVARIYGDEFVVLLPDAGDAAWCAALMSRLSNTIHEPWVHHQNEHLLTASGGIARYPLHADTPEALLAHARRALEQAKRMGKNQVAEGCHNASPHQPGRLGRQRALQQAIEDNELILHYQPKADLRNGTLVGAEALVRWQKPGGAVISPLEFIPLAEESGLIVPLGERVFELACHAQQQWRDQGFDTPPLAVNLSARQLNIPQLAKTLCDTLDRYQLPAELIDLEITETAMVHESPVSRRNLHALAEAGCRIALDDFGTGYSSLSLLRMFPLSILKIDRSFIRDLHASSEAAAITRTVIAMSQQLGLETIAEGVEEESQLRFLARHGCHQIQGYLFSRPLPADDFRLLLSQGHRLDLAAHGIEQLRTLLLLDDESFVLSSLRRVFRQEGYRILTAQSGEEALQLMASNDIQVVIADQRIPGMSGVEFLSRIRDLHPETIRIVLSGYTELDAVISAVNRGAVYKFLTKPWDDTELRLQIRDAFLQHEAKFRVTRLI